MTTIPGALDALAAELGPSLDWALRTGGEPLAAYLLRLDAPRIVAAYIADEYPWRFGPITQTQPMPVVGDGEDDAPTAQLRVVGGAA